MIDYPHPALILAIVGKPCTNGWRADRWDIFLMGETMTCPRNQAGRLLARKRWAVRDRRAFLPAIWKISKDRRRPWPTF